MYVITNTTTDAAHHSSRPRVSVNEPVETVHASLYKPCRSYTSRNINADFQIQMLPWLGILLRNRNHFPQAPLPLPLVHHSILLHLWPAMLSRSLFRIVLFCLLFGTFIFMFLPPMGHPHLMGPPSFTPH